MMKKDYMIGLIWFPAYLIIFSFLVLISVRIGKNLPTLETLGTALIVLGIILWLVSGIAYDISNLKPNDQ